ncbi:glycosyltransferase family 2 protein [Seonamhaeicola maritimus]|uniref:glycosyltransferase family 2 protein n=1 Tax=Seonamhaeicola maritimus TaxID=2591822 RepID=UPI0024950B56|nr:glycosyltransferase family 2 protein [Seonamhaeicola maritimus]
MKLSVVILNYNVRYFLELCLKSVQAAISDLEAEIIVVDNNSEDGSCSMIKELFPKVILIENKENFGFSKGNNIGVREAQGEYLCVLNPDTVVAEDTFKKLLLFSEDKTSLGVVGCKLIDGVGRFLPESKRNIPFVKAAFKKLFGDPSMYYANHLNENDIGEVNVLVGAFMFMKRELYQKIEGFDEDYFMYGEDIDLSYRVLKLGLQNYYYGKTSVIHYKGESTLRDKNYARRFYGAMQIFYKKHFKKNFLLDLFVFFGIRLVYFFRKTPIYKIKRVNKYVLISDKLIGGLQGVLNYELELKNSIDNLDKGDEIIFDAKYLTYKEIIGSMDVASPKKGLTYKIIPQNSNFVLGSDDAISRGEVIVF